MTLSERLQECRNALDWTQAQVAAGLKVPRELITMWESGSRKPGLKQLEELSRLYRTDLSYLLGETNIKLAQDERQLLYRGIERDQPTVRVEIERGLKFLDDWAELVSDEPDFKKARVPKELDEGPTFTDTRKAPTKAKQLRELFNLGNFALPDLFVFLDEQNVLVCQAKLGTIGDGTKNISGVFFNHPKLGYCILVNSQTSRGRQTFTLAHEFAHALFHYGMPPWIISRQGADESYEFFANAFASHLLVPSSGLNDILDTTGWKNDLDPFKVIVLAHTFRVSYAFMLLRLEKDGHIKPDQKKAWQELSPSSLAHRVGLQSSFFQSQEHIDLEIKRYPPSVLRKIKHFIDTGELTDMQVVDLLDVDVMTVRREFLACPAKAEESEQAEVSEFAFA
jgi:Zn-dependent peptidase ImmA (M78 family)/transcriptional regulator with XRE-family HTH domain